MRLAEDSRNSIGPRCSRERALAGIEFAISIIVDVNLPAGDQRLACIANAVAVQVVEYCAA